MFLGIDVSKYQGKIDWHLVQKEDLHFAMIRIGYATVLDSRFAENIENAQKAGIHCGAYLYSYAETPEEAKREAEFVLQAIEPYTFQYPIALDVENKAQGALTPKALADVCVTFCETLEKAGYYAILYSTASWLENKLTDPRLKRYDKWVAHVDTEKPAYSGSYGMWQYSWKGRINGITGNVDLDRAYRDYAKIIADAGLNRPGGTVNYQQLYVRLREQYNALVTKLETLTAQYPPIPVIQSQSQSQSQLSLADFPAQEETEV